MKGQDDIEKRRKLNLNKRKYLVCNKSNTIKVKPDLYYVKTNSYTKISSQYYKTREESPENHFFGKGNNSIKSRSNTTKLKLDLYYVKTNPYMKFQVNMSKDDKEKFGKRKFSKGQ